MNAVTITEEHDPMLVKGDIDAAEMYLRLASDLTRQLFESPEEEYIAGAHALIERALRDTEAHHGAGERTRQQSQQTGSVSEAKAKAAPRARKRVRAAPLTALERRGRLEKQWLDGWQAPHAAVRLCLTAGIELPQWAHDAIMRFFTETRIEGPLPHAPRPLTAPGKTRIRAHIADRLMQSTHCDTGAAAAAAIEAMREVAAWGQRAGGRCARSQRNAETREGQRPSDPLSA